MISMRTLLVLLGAVTVTVAATVIEARSSTIDTRCIVASGGAAARCVRKYADAIAACRLAGDAACETTLRAPAGQLDTVLAATEKPVRDECSAEAADRLTSL